MSHETYQEMEKACNREDGIDEIGSIEHIRAHIKKLNDQAKKRDDCGFFDDLCDELETQSRQHMQEIGRMCGD